MLVSPTNYRYASFKSSSIDGCIPVAWFTRKCTKSTAWGNGLALVPWMAQAGERLRRVGTSDEEPAHFLPVTVELTGKSVVPMGASIAGSSVRLTKRCVDRLRAFLVPARPNIATHISKAPL
eukprot:scaffold14805_cov121-Isochrysis_galbana.AAC.7